MPQFSTTRFVRHSADQMFDLVADVERYPEFVPMCERLTIRRQAEQGEGVRLITAEMSIGYKLIRERFTSRVLIDRARREILVSYIDGPFSHLENRWNFAPTAEGCEVRFAIDYEFRSRALALLAGAVFDTVFRKMTESFEKRADALYGAG